MPTEAPASDSAVCARRVLRLAFGTALSLWISQAGGWTLSFFAPVLTLVVLGLPLSRPPLKFFVSLLLMLVLAIYGSFLLLPLLLHQRFTGLIILGLALFHCFYFTARGGPALLGTLLTIGLTLTVALGTVSVDALLTVAEGASIGALVGIGIAWLCHQLLPDLAEPVAPPAPVRSDPALARHNALRSLAIVLPVTMWFLVSPASAANVAVMIKVAAMGQEAATAPPGRLAHSLLVSTAAGGLAGVIGWVLLSAWPSLTLYTILVALAGIAFGNRIFQGRGVHPDAPTWSYGFLTMLVVLAPAVLDSPFGSDAGARFYDRLLMFAGAVLYGLAAIYAFDALFGRRDPVPEPGVEPGPGEAPTTTNGS